MDQLTFSGRSKCEAFEPNIFARQKCRACGAQLRDHKREAVKDVGHIQAAIEADSKSTPASLVYCDEKTGSKLWQGGFMACRVKFLKAHKIESVVNTAKNLDSFFVKWGKRELPKVKERGVEILDLGWIDSESQNLWREEKFDQLVQSAKFIDAAMSNEKSVLVHCAQGKSRSSAATIAFLMSKCGTSADESLKMLKDKRKMAQPNANFMKQLVEFEKSSALAKLRGSIG
mmetsp:Transcript_11681/g.28779  ORF Transcript_11681/g.28779 Transcript_11681/m.28779 type:complete len:230 (-) Transcript_11681:175-864(-)